MTDGKQHVSIVICGHVDAGKSTTTGRLIFELGGIPEREMQKLRDEADRLGKGSFAFAFYMDRQKEERERGVTISCTTKEFFTETKHYTVIDAPGHRSFIKNMITGASQADVALIMIPADGNFTTSIARGNAKTGEVQGQTRQHSLLINLLGVKQIIVGINKMDSDVAQYKEARYKEIKEEMVSTLIKVGWPKVFVETSVPFLPISGWIGDNLIKKSENMPWYTGSEIVLPNKNKITVHTLKEALELMVVIPERSTNAIMRTPISGIYKIKGIGDVLTGRVEQGTVKPGEEVVFLPTHTSSTPCQGKVFSVEMHHKVVESATSGDNCGFNIKGLVKENMPRVGDIMILKKDESIGRAYSFTSQVRVLEHPGELKVGYCPIAFVRTGRSAVRMSAINWKIGKESGNTKVPNPTSLKSNEMGEAVFEPMQPFVVDTFKNCEGLGRVAIMEGASVIMLGKVTAVDFKEKPKEEPKKEATGQGKPKEGAKPQAGAKPTTGAKPQAGKAAAKK
jgi:elongation factor 1-alpha